jgi:hypothetical protein
VSLRWHPQISLQVHVEFEKRTAYMPAKSKKQQMAAGAALAAKRGKRSKSSLRGASRQMASSMSEKQLRDFAQTKRKKLPRKKSNRSKRS